MLLVQGSRLEAGLSQFKKITTKHRPPEQLPEQGVEQGEDEVYDEETVKLLADKTLPALEGTARERDSGEVVSTAQRHYTATLAEDSSRMSLTVSPIFFGSAATRPSQW